MRHHGLSLLSRFVLSPSRTFSNQMTSMMMNSAKLSQSSRHAVTIMLTRVQMVIWPRKIKNAQTKLTLRRPSKKWEGKDV